MGVAGGNAILASWSTVPVVVESMVKSWCWLRGKKEGVKESDGF